MPVSGTYFASRSIYICGSRVEHSRVSVDDIEFTAVLIADDLVHLKPPRGCSNHSSCLVGEEARDLILRLPSFLYLNDEELMNELLLLGSA
jgi:hypothetical protein